MCACVCGGGPGKDSGSIHIRIIKHICVRVRECVRVHACVRVFVLQQAHIGGGVKGC